jgi:hypothetical protein
MEYFSIFALYKNDYPTQLKVNRMETYPTSLNNKEIKKGIEIILSNNN